MKKVLCCVLAMAVLLAASAGCAADGEDVFYSYDFSFRFHLNAEIFPKNIRSHMEGYAELLDILEFRGNITGCAETRAIDLRADIVPVTNPSAAVSFRLYGIPEHLCLSSPLLGSETIWFQNYVFMEFALKAWNNLHIPVQYLALLYPYVTENAFRNLSGAWDEFIGFPSRSGKIRLADLKTVAGEWDRVLQDDYRLFYWVSALSALSDETRFLELEFRDLPDYLLNRVAGGKDLQVKVADGSVSVLDSRGASLFERREDADGLSLRLSLPATANGYLPSLEYASSVSDQGISASVSGSYRLAADEALSESPAVESGYLLPDSLLELNGELESFPSVWPSADVFSASLSVGGVLLPNHDIRLEGRSAEDGSFSFSILQPASSGGEPVQVLSCAGSVVPVPPASAPVFSVDELTSHTNVFSVNDQTSASFVGNIRRPLFMGLLNFLYEVPAHACRSVMDDLESYGLLDMLSAD